MKYLFKSLFKSTILAFLPFLSLSMHISSTEALAKTKKKSDFGGLSTVPDLSKTLPNKRPGGHSSASEGGAPQDLAAIQPSPPSDAPAKKTIQRPPEEAAAAKGAIVFGTNANKPAPTPPKSISSPPPDTVRPF